MKKSLFALAAVGAMSGAAQAQSSVTVYGLFDGGLVTQNVEYAAARTKQTLNTVGGQQSSNGSGTFNGSRLGFRGVEDLGGGTTAGFAFEVGVTYNGTNSLSAAAATESISNSIGNSAMFGNTRQAYGSLANKGFGEIRVGTQDTLTKVNTETFDPLGGASITGGTSLYQQSLQVRANAVTYMAPAIAGVSVRVQMQNDQTTTNSAGTGRTNSAFNADAIYRAGNLVVGGSYQNMSNANIVAGANHSINPMAANGATALNGGIQYYNLGASYDFGVVKPSVLYYNQKMTGITTASTGIMSGTLLGLAIPVTSTFSILGNYTMGKVTNNNAALYNTNAQQVAGVYTLSKRTNLYAVYGGTNFNTKVTTTSDVNFQSYGVGMRHTF
jgi:predicted porin